MSDTKRAKNAPEGLGLKAKELWSKITREFELRPDELEVLEDACRETDLIERMEAKLTEPTATLLSRGSTGQAVAHPLLQEIRQHRTVKARLLADLKLGQVPEAGAGTPGARSSSAREAARARWNRGA